MIVVGFVGLYFRVTQLSPMTGQGFDEHLYETYVREVTDSGIFNYPKIVNGYINYQRELPYSILPPMRFLYICVSWLWRMTFHTDALTALKSVATAFSVLTMTISFVFALRLGRARAWRCSR